MTTPQYPDPNQPPDPSAYRPPDPSAYQPPSGAYQQPGTAPQPGQPPAYQPGDPYQPAGAYPPPGAPGGAYPPPGAPGGPMPGAPGAQPKKNTPRIVMGVVIAAVVILGVVLYVVNRQSDPSTAKAGDCVKVNSMSSDNADVSKVACTDPSAAFTVTAAGTSGVTCDENEDKYTESTKSGTTTTTLCLQPNVTAGDCWKSPTDADTPESKVDCATTKGQDDVVKVLAFDHTTSNENSCPAGTQQYLSYTLHKGVLCVKPNS